MNSYDDVRKLYDALLNDNFQKAQDTLKHLIHNHGLTKKYIKETMRTIALEKIMLTMFDEITKELKKG